jgi:hygromycin-B 4-O-kinase
VTSILPRESWRREVKGEGAIDCHVAQEFLKENFSEGAVRLEQITGGELAEAFFFEVTGTEYVLRVSAELKHFLKDRYAFEHFRSSAIPIPRVVKYGRFDSTRFYAVSERALGVQHAELPRSQQIAAVPSMLRTLDAIHAIDVSGSNEFVDWPGGGHAPGSSDHRAASSIQARKESFTRPWVDQEFHLFLREQMRPLLKYLPEERYLMHGDYGGRNLIIHRGEVTGVLDWGNSKYGDFMRDVALLDFWDRELDYGGIVREHYGWIGKTVPHYTERLRLHKLACASDSLEFYASFDREAAYGEVLALCKATGLG